MGEVITFYSFKGGVGRSMALANIAAIYAQRGKRVLALDFDFEAPGLHRYFLKPERYEPRAALPGMLNFFVALRNRLRARFGAQRPTDDGAICIVQALIADEFDSGKYVYKVRLSDPNGARPRSVAIDFVAAARFDATYPELVHAFDWQDFYDNYAGVFPALVDELGHRYDIILVDSRTGVTDIGSICTMALPDKLVLVFSPNEQSLQGALDAGWQAVHGSREARAKRKLGIFPLVSRVEESEEDHKRAWIKRARDGFEQLVSAAYGVEECDLDAYFDAVRIPHRAYYAYGERIAADEQPVRESGSLAQAFDRLADSLECPGVVEAQRALAAEERELRSRDSEDDFYIKLLEAGKLSERPSEAVRAYDDLIPRIRTRRAAQPGLGLDMMLLGALNNQAHALAQLYRFDESIKLFRETLREFADVSSPLVLAEVNRATFNLGTSLDRTGRYDEALELYEQLIERLRGQVDAQSVEARARALFAKGTMLSAQGRDAEAVAVYDQVINAFRDSPIGAVQSQVLKAMTNKGAAFSRLDNAGAALIVREEILRRFAKSDDPEHRASVALAWVGKIASMAQQGEHLKAIAECDEMLARFSEMRDPAVLKYVAGVMNIKSGSLDSLDRKDEALATLDALLDRIGKLRSPLLAEPIASALLLKSLYLSQSARHDEARAVRAELVRRFRGELDGLVVNAVASALVLDVGDLEKAGRFEDALRGVEEFLAWFPGSADPNLRRNFYGVSIARNVLLARLGRYHDAVVSADEAHARIGSAHDAEAKELAPRALATKGFARLCLAKERARAGDDAKARTLWEEADAIFRSALEVAPADPSILGDASYAAFLLGHADRASELLTRAIALGGNAVREGELRDADICSLPQDDDFRALVRSIPSELGSTSPSA